MKLSKNQKGFTPVELLFVILVIGILVLISVSFLNSSRTKARDAKRVVDIRRIQTSLEFYNLDESSYPTYEAPIILGIEGTSKLCETGFVSQETTCSKEYMAVVPKDPSTSGKYVYQGSSEGYVLQFVTEDVTDLGNAGVYYAHSEIIDKDPAIK